MFQGSGIQLCDILELAAVGAGAVVAPLFVLQSGQRLFYEEVADGDLIIVILIGLTVMILVSIQVVNGSIPVQFFFSFVAASRN